MKLRRSQFDGLKMHTPRRLSAYEPIYHPRTIILDQEIIQTVRSYANHSIRFYDTSVRCAFAPEKNHNSIITLLSLTYPEK